MGRYSDFWPLQGMKGAGTGTGANFPTVALFNNSTGANYLVVRENFTIATTAFVLQGGYVQGRLSGTNFPAQPLVPTEKLQAGLVDFSNQAAALAEISLYGNSAWFHDFPLAIIPPGWSWAWQSASAGDTIKVSFQWEAVDAQQIRPLFESLYEGA